MLILSSLCLKLATMHTPTLIHLFPQVSGSRPPGYLRAVRQILLGMICLISLNDSTFVETASAEPKVLTTAAHETASQRIRRITIEIKDVFEDQDDLGSFYRTVNSLKINTKEDVVRRELLFKEGDLYDPFLIQESERFLRSLPFLRRVKITPIPEGEFIDVQVTVQDTWTLIPQLGFSLGGGSNKSQIGIAESNVLGYGKRAEILLANDEDRQKIEAVYHDKRFWGSSKQLTVGGFDRSDGYRGFGSFGQPFRSLAQRSAWNTSADVSDTIGRLFENGDESFIFRDEHIEGSLRYFLSQGEPDILVKRIGLGYDYEKDDFSEADASDFDDIDLDPSSVSQDPDLLADDREFSGPTVGVERIESQFFSLNYIDRFERVQDFAMGNHYSLQFTYAAEALGSERDTILVSTSDTDGWKLSPSSFIRGEVGASSRLNADGFDNTLFRAEARYYNVLGSKFFNNFFLGKHTIAGNFAFNFGEGLDKDRQFTLGANNGLRGYENRAFNGDKSFVMNFEDRFHIVEDFMRLINIGGAVFVDAGGMSHRAVGDVFTKNFHTDVGIGLRFGLPRAGSGGVLRVDLAVPLRDGDDGTSKFEPRLLVSTGQLFSSRLSSESLGPVEANVGVGFDR